MHVLGPCRVHAVDIEEAVGAEKPRRRAGPASVGDSVVQGVTTMEDDPEPAGDRRQTLQTIQMLREVIDGDPYATVAQRWGLSRSAVDRRIKGLAVQLTQAVGVDGLQESGAAFVKRLRMHRDAILQALGHGPLIFNLGHGITPQADPEHVTELVAQVRSFG